jgi:hypothetical protein
MYIMKRIYAIRIWRRAFFNEVEMKTRAKLKPGQKGTKKLVERYGDALVCVRYRYDPVKCKQLKTVEIVVSETDWSPPPAKFPESLRVPLRIGVAEKKLQEQVKGLGGRWDRQQQVWLIPYGCIAGTHLEKFIVLEIGKKAEKQQSL